MSDDNPPKKLSLTDDYEGVITQPAPEPGGEWQRINATVYDTDDFSFSVRSHKPGRAEEIATQIVADHAAVEKLRALLRETLRDKIQTNGKCDHDAAMIPECLQCQMTAALLVNDHAALAVATGNQAKELNDDKS